MRFGVRISALAAMCVLVCGCDNDTVEDAAYLVGLGDLVSGIQHVDVSGPEAWRSFVEQGWAPASLPPSAQIESFVRDHRLDVSHITFVLSAEQAAVLAPQIEPIDWDRFPGLRNNPEARPDLSDAMADGGMVSIVTDALASGETCEDGIYWRYFLRTNGRGTVSSSVYQPGHCPEPEATR